MDASSSLAVAQVALLFMFQLRVNMSFHSYLVCTMCLSCCYSLSFALRLGGGGCVEETVTLSGLTLYLGLKMDMVGLLMLEESSYAHLGPRARET